MTVKCAYGFCRWKLPTDILGFLSICIHIVVDHFYFSCEDSLLKAGNKILTKYTGFLKSSQEGLVLFDFTDLAGILEMEIFGGGVECPILATESAIGVITACILFDEYADKVSININDEYMRSPP